MKSVMMKYDAESVRWMGYHTAVKNFFESVASLPNIPGYKGIGSEDQNIKVIYATPSSAFTKYVVPMVNGLTQRPIITFYLSNEETINDLAGTPFLINQVYYKEGDNYKKATFRRPLMKTLTYTCNIFTTKMSDCDYILTLLELSCDKFKPYSCRVNGRPTQFYLDNVETGTPTDYEGKKFISSSFVITTPLASIFPVEIETDVDIIKTVNTYLSDDVLVIPETMYSKVDKPLKKNLRSYYEKTETGYVLTSDDKVVTGKDYYTINEKYNALSDYIEKLKNMYSEVEEPVLGKLPLYYEFINHEYVKTNDKNIVEGKTYYIKNS